MNLRLNGQEMLKRIVPPVVAVLLIVCFVSLGMWQLDRAAYKKRLYESFRAEADYERVLGEMPVSPYQPIKSYGHYLGDRQFLIDNIVKNGRVGWYVVTPFEYSVDEPLLLVNRGWLAKPLERGVLPDVDTAPGNLEVKGRARNLPLVGIRPGEAFEGSESWPRLGVYPTLDEVAAELDRDVLQFVLLLDPEPSSGMLRQWQPVQSGPATHYGYAFQWFAMAVTVLGIFILHLRKRFRRESGQA